MVEGYAARLSLPITTEELQAAGGRMVGDARRPVRRVAWQFIQDLAGRLGMARD